MLAYCSVADRATLQPSSEERRDSPRLPATFEIRLGATQSFRTVGGDLSLGGAAFDAQLPVGMGIDLRLQLDGAGIAGPLYLQGRLIGNEAGRCRLVFEEPPLAAELALARHLHARALGEALAS